MLLLSNNMSIRTLTKNDCCIVSSSEAWPSKLHAVLNCEVALRVLKMAHDCASIECQSLGDLVRDVRHQSARLAYAGKDVMVGDALQKIDRFAEAFSADAETKVKCSLLPTVLKNLLDEHYDTGPLTIFLSQLTANDTMSHLSVTIIDRETFAFCQPFKASAYGEGPALSLYTLEKANCEEMLRKIVECIKTCGEDCWLLLPRQQQRVNVCIAKLVAERDYDFDALPRLEMDSLLRLELFESLKQLADRLENENREKFGTFQMLKSQLESKKREMDKLEQQLLARMRRLKERAVAEQRKKIEKSKKAAKKVVAVVPRPPSPVAERSIPVFRSISPPPDIPVDEFECMICMSPCKLDDLFFMSNCQVHMLCRDCAKRHIVTDIGNRKIPIKCPDPQCDAFIAHSDLDLILTQEEWQLYMDAERDTAVASGSGGVYCPQPNCRGVAIVDPPNRHFICPICMYVMCVNCKKPWHDEAECPDGAEKALDDTVLENLGMKRCPKCKTPTEKIPDGGCNHMKCAICKTDYCITCGIAVAKPDGGWNDNGHQCSLFDLGELAESLRPGARRH